MLLSCCLSKSFAAQIPAAVFSSRKVHVYACSRNKRALPRCPSARSRKSRLHGGFILRQPNFDLSHKVAFRSPPFTAMRPVREARNSVTTWNVRPYLRGPDTRDSAWQNTTTTQPANNSFEEQRVRGGRGPNQEKHENKTYFSLACHNLRRSSRSFNRGEAFIYLG